jgi:hypothetical protein
MLLQRLLFNENNKGRILSVHLTGENTITSFIRESNML